MTKLTCTVCGSPATKLCDGRIVTLPHGTEIRIPHTKPNANFRAELVRTCDTPLCIGCAIKKSDIHYRTNKGGRWDTVDLCPKCNSEVPE